MFFDELKYTSIYDINIQLMTGRNEKYKFIEIVSLMRLHS